MGSEPNNPEAARRKAAAMSSERKAQQHGRRVLLWSGAGFVVVAVAVVVGVVAGTNNPGKAGAGGTATASASLPATVPAAQGSTQGSTQAPPWAAPVDASARARAAGLQMLTAEGAAEHIHTHLDITVDGKVVTVPADIGIDLAAQLISPLHTHDTSGIIHVESPVVRPFSLGEVFTEWNVALSAKEVGSYSTANGYTITTYVDGKKVSGDPAAITLAEHEDVDIVITQGSAAAAAPAAFSWPAGY